MSDPISTAAAGISIFSALKKAIDALRNRARESGDAEWITMVSEAQSQFMESQGVLMELQQKVGELHKENSKLRELGDLTYNDGCYWDKKEDDWEGPFCVSCKDGDGKKVRMEFPRVHRGTGEAGTRPECPVCNHWGKVPNPKPPSV